jgi:hypothetical protein
MVYFLVSVPVSVPHLIEIIAQIINTVNYKFKFLALDQLLLVKTIECETNNLHSAP